MRNPAFALPFLCACLAAAPSWPPIPPEVWAMQEDPAKGINGAVVLEQRMSFTGTAIKHSLRLRVLSERGKGLAQLPMFLPEATGIEGRTVLPDGTAIPFDKAKDFLQKTVTSGASERERQVLLPPGLTSNCVLDLRWTDLAQGGDTKQLPESLGYSAQWRLGWPFLTRQLVVEFWPQFRWAAYVNPGNVPYPTTENRGRHTIYTFTNIPALEDSPYSLPSLSGRPTVHVWKQPELLLPRAQANPDEYWAQSARVYWREFYHNKLRKGRSYAALSTALRKDLPADPVAAATALMQRLDQRILNLDHATPEEEARLKKNAAREVEENDLERAVDDGWTRGLTMTLLYYALATDAGLHPRWVFVRNRDNHLFHCEVPDIWQLTDLLIAIPVPGKPSFLLDPTLRDCTPGLVPPEYQGAGALAVNPEGWTTARMDIPAQEPEFNRSKFQARIGFQDGLETFSLKGAFTGFREWLVRDRYRGKTQAEADRTLKEQAEKDLKDATISRAAVSGAWTPGQGAAWEIEGQRELASTGTLRVDPFPGMPAPLYLPTAWPSPRTVPVMMGHLRVFEAESEVRVPAGYAVLPQSAMQKENGFGRVFFSVGTRSEGDTQVATVSLRVELRAIFGMAAGEPALRQFLGWVEDAYRRVLVLEKR